MQTLFNRLSPKRIGLLTPIWLLAISWFALNRNVSFADDIVPYQTFVTPSTILVGMIDTKSLVVPDELLDGAKSLDSLFAGKPVYVCVDIPYSKTQTPIRLYVQKGAGLNSKRLHEWLQRFQFSPPVITGDFLCFSLAHNSLGSNTVTIKETTLSSKRPEFEKAFVEVGGFPIQMAVVPPSYVRQTVRELMPTLPAWLGGGASRVLTEGVAWGAFGLEPTTFRFRTLVQSESESAARELSQSLPQFGSLITGLRDAPKLSALLKSLTNEVKEDRIVLSYPGTSDSRGAATELWEVIGKFIKPLVSQRKMDSLREIVLAMHNYENTFKSITPIAKHRDADGRCRLSWRVHILPYLGMNELYNQFHLEESWDSEHNIKLLEKIPAVYQPVNVRLSGTNALKPGYTVYLAPFSPETIMGKPKPVKYAAIADGTSNTIIVVEVKPEFAKPWTSPEDYTYDPANPTEGLAVIESDPPSFLAARADCSVMRHTLTKPARAILNLFEMADGNASED